MWVALMPGVWSEGWSSREGLPVTVPSQGHHFSMDLSIFSLFNLILLFQTFNYEENLYKISLILYPSLFTTHVCLMANLIPSNLTKLYMVMLPHTCTLGINIYIQYDSI